MVTKMKILFKNENETIRYAAEELKKYFEMMCDEKAELTPSDTLSGEGIVLGLLSDFDLSEEGCLDPMTDDVTDVKIDGFSGYIAGSNPRSILMGVYDYLKSAGCMWVRPGPEGEYIPKADLSAHSFTYRKAADYKFRGECLEGAVSYEHLRDTIIWSPKVGLNLFMMEYIVPYNYISRWYNHDGNTVKKKGEKISYEAVKEMCEKLELLIHKCGLQLHSLGHGYLFEPYGIRYTTWDAGYELVGEAKEDTALVNGVREFQISPSWTQLCFSKERVQSKLVNYLTEYLERKPHIDFLHVWLGDAANNQCECEECVKLRPSDYYVQMLNRLDAELTKRNINTKIVFIMYVDTLWAPIKEKLNNPKRFILTMTPNRDYSESYKGDRFDKPLPPYKRNEFELERSFALNLSLMDAWKPAFDGPKFIFEYYMYTAHYYDMGYFQMSRTVFEDTKTLKGIGFDGIMCDQTQRCYLPTGLPNAIMGEGLRDINLDFNEYSRAYFEASFGEDADKAYEYLENITKLFNPDQLRSTVSEVDQDTGIMDNVISDKSWKGDPEVIARLKSIRPYVESFRDTIKKNMKQDNPCHKKSWTLLDYHADICINSADIYIALAEYDKDRAKRVLDKTIDWLSRVEDEIAPEFDLVLYKQRMVQTINLPVVSLIGDISEVKEGIDILLPKLNIVLSEGGGYKVNVKRCEKGLYVTNKDGKYEIQYNEKTDFYRALALLANAFKSNKKIEIREERQFKTSGAMIDVSRGLVYKKEAVFDILEYMALMGMNMFMLYTEDTYKMEKYPMFGYLRGGYSVEELKEIDDYAYTLGIEVIPCIQTLGHMERYLRWPEAKDIKDTKDVMLAGADKTYEFIEESFKTMRSAFRSDRIHIGMDEAIGIGTGNYLKHNEPSATKDIMAKHLVRVSELCEKYNYHPMIWSDMFFRLSGYGGEYDTRAEIPKSLKDELPRDVEMIYWDYVMESEETNDIIIKKHFEMERPCGFASAIWTFNRFVTCYKKSYDTSRHQLKACKKNNLDTVMTTVWNNGSSYSSLYTILPGLQAFAELSYDVNADEAKIAENFKAVAGYDFEDFKLLFVDDFTDEEREKYNPEGHFCINASFQHFFNDIMVGTLDKSLSGYDFKSKYEKFAREIAKVDMGGMQDVFDRFKTFYEIIAIKAGMGTRLRDAYHAGDKAEMANILEEARKLEELYKTFKAQTDEMWYSLCKPFGNNALDAELGLAEMRTRTAIYRIESYLSGKVESLPELEEEIQYYNGYDKPLIEVNSPFVFSKV